MAETVQVYVVIMMFLKVSLEQNILQATTFVVKLYMCNKWDVHDELCL